jgi:hypothetical protein
LPEHFSKSLKFFQNQQQNHTMSTQENPFSKIVSESVLRQRAEEERMESAKQAEAESLRAASAAVLEFWELSAVPLMRQAVSALRANDVEVELAIEAENHRACIIVLAGRHPARFCLTSGHAFSTPHIIHTQRVPGRKDLQTQITTPNKDGITSLIRVFISDVFR